MKATVMSVSVRKEADGLQSRDISLLEEVIRKAKPIVWNILILHTFVVLYTFIKIEIRCSC